MPTDHNRRIGCLWQPFTLSLRIKIVPTNVMHYYLSNQ